jgi:hypothetical protein
MRDRVGHLRNAARSPHLRLSWREYSIRRQALCQGIAPTADWTRLSGTIDGQPLRLDRGHNLEHRRIFDMRKAFSGGSGDIKMNPVGSRGYERCASPQWSTIMPENFSGLDVPQKMIVAVCDPIHTTWHETRRLRGF